MALICNHGLKLGRFCIAGAVLFMAGACGSAHALTNYGCNDEKNDRITPELALCTVHAYNIGQSHNPDDAAQKQLMQDVVALKTTVITQQMYKQYEYMDAMIKRFKTQLEKAVLTSKLQMAGASTGTTGGASSAMATSGDRNIYLAGVQNCNNELTNLKVFECLNSNLNVIYNMSNNGVNISLELRKQLANDFKVASSASGNTDKSASGIDITVSDCTNYKNISQRKQFQACLDELRSRIRKGYEAASTSNKKPESRD